MRLIFSANAWEEYLDWQRTTEMVLKRIHALIKDSKRNPTAGLGEPERLKHALRDLDQQISERLH